MKNLEKGLISVIMPAYNAEDYIRQAIESILVQTYIKFELIIIEDCSTDDTKKIIEEYASKDNRIVAVYKDKNNGSMGFIENLNYGLSIAKGEFIARMDADDISSSDRFAKQIVFLNDNPDIFLVGSGAEVINSQGNSIGKFRFSKRVSSVNEALPRRNYIIHPSVMFRNSSEAQYRLLYAEDYDLWLQFLKEGRQMVNLNETLLKYRVLENSLSNQNVLRNYVSAAIAQKLYFEQVEFSNVDPVVTLANFERGKMNFKDELALVKNAFWNRNKPLSNQLSTQSRKLVVKILSIGLFTMFSIKDFVLSILRRNGR